MNHQRLVRKTSLDVIWECTCGWTTWQRRAQNVFARNATLLKAWRKHIAKTYTKEAAT